MVLDYPSAPAPHSNLRHTWGTSRSIQSIQTGSGLDKDAADGFTNRSSDSQSSHHALLSGWTYCTVCTLWAAATICGCVGLVLDECTSSVSLAPSTGEFSINAQVTLSLSLFLCVSVCAHTRVCVTDNRPMNLADQGLHGIQGVLPHLSALGFLCLL